MVYIRNKIEVNCRFVSRRPVAPLGGPFKCWENHDLLENDDYALATFHIQPCKFAIWKTCTAIGHGI